MFIDRDQLAGWEGGALRLAVSQPADSRVERFDIETQFTTHAEDGAFEKDADLFTASLSNLASCCTIPLHTLRAALKAGSQSLASSPDTNETPGS